jgi:hypothetical protein
MIVGSKFDFRAPWGNSLIIISSLACLLCLGISLSGIYGLGSHSAVTALIQVFMPPGILLGALPFMVRGYSINPQTLVVHRLGWSNTFAVSELLSATFDPTAMKASIRTFGNGGLFSFTGKYYNSTLGSYRAFVTDLKRCVILKYPGQTIVLSPENPQEFVTRLLSARQARA